ncbi:MAG: hypothetical protein OXG33_13140 [Chloroflexi bacterium]|nr:hypothetical protein [Chloroflexota bacterium]
MFERVCEVGPLFRAKPHDTTRHTSEYVSLDIEMGFTEDHRSVMAMLNAVIAAMVQNIADREASSLRPLSAKPPKVPAAIPVVHFTDAQNIVKEQMGERISRPKTGPRPLGVP